MREVPQRLARINLFWTPETVLFVFMPRNLSGKKIAKRTGWPETRMVTGQVGEVKCLQRQSQAQA